MSRRIPIPLSRSELCCWAFSIALHVTVMLRLAGVTPYDGPGEDRVDSLADTFWSEEERPVIVDLVPPPTPWPSECVPACEEFRSLNPNRDAAPADEDLSTIEESELLPCDTRDRPLDFPSTRHDGAGWNASGGIGDGSASWSPDRVPYRLPWSESPIRLAISVLRFPTTLDPSPTEGRPVPLAGNPEPQYPEEARRAGAQGTVIVTLTVNEEGLCTAVAVKSSSGSPELDEAALDACRGWRFTRAPRTWRGPRLVDLPIHFALRKSNMT